MPTCYGRVDRQFLQLLLQTCVTPLAERARLILEECGESSNVWVVTGRTLALCDRFMLDFCCSRLLQVVTFETDSRLVNLVSSCDFSQGSTDGNYGDRENHGYTNRDLRT